MEREVRGVNTDTGRPVIDLDPINVHVTYEDMPSMYRVADGSDDRLVAIWDAMDQYIVAAAERDGTAVEVALVWSDTGRHVKAFCGHCDDPFDVNDEMVISDPGMVCVPCYDDED
jgi:hypothetical protein